VPMTHHERRLWDAAARVVEAQDFVEQDAPNAPETVAEAVENLRGAMTSLEPVWFGDADTEAPRVEWCVEHDCPKIACISVTRRFPYADLIPGVTPCRFVEALVVPLVENAA
jgi:hypothetical protein